MPARALSTALEWTEGSILLSYYAARASGGTARDRSIVRAAPARPTTRARGVVAEKIRIRPTGFLEYSSSVLRIPSYRPGSDPPYKFTCVCGTCTRTDRIAYTAVVQLYHIIWRI
jgi:hypothetical protein